MNLSRSKPKRLKVSGPRFIPYRLRLWWEMRQMVECTCMYPMAEPENHEDGCDVKERWG